jgi:lipopolysaccharide transport system permease protein
MAENTVEHAQNGKMIVHTPESPILHPIQLLRSMITDLRSSFALAYRLTVRDISSMYRQTALGYFWAIFPPLVTSLTFVILNRAKVFGLGTYSIPYPVFVITGTVFWQLFVDALNAPLKVLNANRSMLSKISFPKEALILSGIGQVLFSFAMKILLLCFVLIVFGTPVKWTIAFLILPIMGLLCIGILLGLLLVPVGMLYHDVQHGLVVCTTSLMFFTPVVFIPPDAGLLAKIISINPLSYFILVSREMLFYPELHQLNASLLVLGITLILIVAAWVLYRIALPILIERMEA